MKGMKDFHKTINGEFLLAVIYQTRKAGSINEEDWDVLSKLDTVYQTSVAIVDNLQRYKSQYANIEVRAYIPFHRKMVYPY